MKKCIICIILYANGEGFKSSPAPAENRCRPVPTVVLKCWKIAFIYLSAKNLLKKLLKSKKLLLNFQKLLPIGNSPVWNSSQQLNRSTEDLFIQG